MTGDVVDLGARRSPVTYTVTITHHWDDRLEIFVADVADDDRSRASVADALWRAAQMFTDVQERVASAEVDRLHRCIDAAMGCLDPEAGNPDEVLAWYRLYDAEMGREPRNCMPTAEAPKE